MNSLRLRLHVLLLAGLALLLVVQMLGLRVIPQSLVENYVVTRLQHDADTLYARLLLQPALPHEISPTLGTAYDLPLSGHYFRINADNHIIRSRSLWDVDLPIPALTEARSTISHIAGPADQQLISYSERYQVRGETLTISPGTSVLFTAIDADNNGIGDYDIDISGDLVVNGTAAEPVVFTTYGSGTKAPSILAEKPRGSIPSGVE